MSSSQTPPTITSPFVPDLTDVRAWMEKMIKELAFVTSVTAIVALVRRMQDINFDLTKKLPDLRRADLVGRRCDRLDRRVLSVAGRHAVLVAAPDVNDHEALSAPWFPRGS